MQWFKDYLEGCSRGVIFGRDIAPILTGPGVTPPTLIASPSAILRLVALLYLICFGEISWDTFKGRRQKSGVWVGTYHKIGDPSLPQT